MKHCYKNRIYSVYIAYIFTDFIYFQREGKGSRKRGREHHVQEKHQLVASYIPPTWDPACNPDLCPEGESNHNPLVQQASAPSTEPHQPGQHFMKTLICCKHFAAFKHPCNNSFNGHLRLYTCVRNTKLRAYCPFFFRCLVNTCCAPQLRLEFTLPAKSVTLIIVTLLEIMCC